MENKRKINSKLTDEQLLEALEQKESEVDFAKKLQDDVLNFIIKFGVNPGKFRVRKKLLYHVYKNWSRNPVNDRTFNYTLNMYVDSNSSTVKISMSAFKFTEHAYETIRKELKPKKDSLASKKRHFESFIKRFDLTKPATRIGRQRIHVGVLIYLYDIYCYDKGYKEHLLTDKQFRSFLNLYFENTRTRVGYSYYVKKSPLSEEQVKTALEWYVHQGRRHEKSKKDSPK